MQQGRNRDEPSLGDLGVIDRDVDHRGRATRRRRRRTGSGPVTAVVLLVAAVALLAWFREPLQRLVSGSETARLVESAQQAEQAGRWYHDEQGNDALAIYRRILAENEDNDPAREGLRRVAQRLFADAEAAIGAGDHARVPHLLDELAALGEPGDRIDGLRQRLDAARSADRELDAMLERAQAALRERRVRGDNGALAEFQRMLARDPGNAVARRGVDESLAALIVQAREALAAGDTDRAGALIESVAGHSPQHVDLPAVRQELAQAQARQAEQERQRKQQELADAIARHLATAGQEADAGRVVQAAAAYRKVLDLDGGHAAARRGLSRVAGQLLDQVEAAIADSNLPQAQASLAQARRSGADEARVQRLASRLADLEERLTSVLAKPELSAEQQRRLDGLMQRAMAADRQGRLVEPAGDSAYDLYRQALTIDPTVDAARRGIEALPRRAQALAVHHIELGQWQQAAQAIDALQAMAPLDPVVPELRSQLAAARGRQ